MKKNIAAILISFFLLVCAISAQDTKGLWTGLFEADDVFAAIGLNLDESKIVLSFAGDERSGTIKNLKTENGEISFEAELQPRAIFKGTIEGEKISGTFDILRRDGTKGSAGVWTARKVDSLDFKNENPVSTNQKLELPKPSGAFPIGRKFFYWIDESRAEDITDDTNDKRKIFVQLWYPAKKSKGQTAEYRPNLAELHPKSEQNDFLSSVKIHAVQDAKIADGKTKFPVIIFSPGLGSNPFAYTSIIENLVSRGYAVAAINHPYDTGDFKFSDGQIIRNNAEKWNRQVSKDWTADERKQFFDERRLGWAADISFVVNQLEKLENSFKKRLDFQNPGVFGHSFGGQAVSIACAADTRFKACANLDGLAQGNAVLPDASGKMMKQPFLFFSKSAEVTDAELRMMNLTRAEYRVRERKRLSEKWTPSFKKQLAELESGAYWVLYPGVKHSSFGDSLLLYTKPNEELFAERFAAAQNINDYVAQFFDKFLMKKSAPLFDNPNDVRPPVILEFLKKK